MISYLQKRRGRYFIRVRVPHELRALYSGQFVERHLGTGDYDEAKRKAPDALAPIFDDFAARRAGVAAVAPALDHIFATARARAYAAIIAGKPIPFIDGRTALEGRDVPAAGSIDVADVAIAEALQEAERMATYNLPAPSPVAPWRASVKPGEPVQSLADLESYLASFEGLAKPLYIAKRRGSIKAILATMPNLADVTRPAVQAWHDANRTMAPESLKRHRNDARGFFKWLRAHGKLAGLPSESDDVFEARKLSLPKESEVAKAERERLSFTTAEIKRLVSTARENDDGELADLIIVGMWSGARLGELTSLTAAQVDLKAKSFRAGTKTLAGFNREIPIHPALLATMTRLIKAAAKRKDGSLFASGDRLGDRFTDLKTGLGFDDRHVFHSIRHGAAGRLRAVRPAVAEYVINALMGWANVGMLARYAKDHPPTLADKRDALEKISYQR